MSRSITYYFKRINRTFNSQKDLKELLKEMLNKYKQSRETVSEEDRLILIDYLEEYHPSSQWFLNNFNLEDSEFYVKESPKYSTECFYIQEGTQQEADFSITKFISPSSKQNLSSLLRYLIKDLKVEIRKTLCPDNWENYDLVHISPKFDDVVQEFIQQENLQDKLDDVVSDNYGDSNVPFFKAGYEYLSERFIFFYKQKYQNYSEQYKLRKIT